jgi:nucleotide-binding universal stress UspA family protein
VLRIKRIVVATDFTEASDGAIDYALELAQTFDASVILVHAYDVPIVGFPDGVLIASPNVATQVETAAEEGLRAAVERRSASGVRIDPMLRQGDIADEVNRAAEETQADMIVVGTHGRRGIAHAILGSVAEKIIRTAKRPVLTLHEDQEKKAA